MQSVLMVKDFIVIYRKNETILVLIGLETLFSHPGNSVNSHRIIKRRAKALIRLRIGAD